MATATNSIRKKKTHKSVSPRNAFVISDRIALWNKTSRVPSVTFSISAAAAYGMHNDICSSLSSSETEAGRTLRDAESVTSASNTRILSEDELLIKSLRYVAFALSLTITNTRLFGVAA